MDDSGLIQKSCGGERAIFNKLVVECEARVYNYVRYRFPGDHFTAEDSNQKILVKAWRKICTLKHDNFIAWVYTIVRCMCADEWLARIKIDYVTLNDELDKVTDSLTLDSERELAERSDAIREWMKGLMTDRQEVIQKWVEFGT